MQVSFNTENTLHDNKGERRDPDVERFIWQ